MRTRREATQGGGQGEGSETGQEDPSLAEDIAQPATGYHAYGEDEGVAGDDEFRFGEGRAQALS